jgi:acyl-CoA thioesterase-1
MKNLRFERPLRYGPWIGRINAALLSAALCLMFASAARADQVRILALGDSLTAGYGLAQGDGFTDQLQRALQADGYDVFVINGGVSGDTTAGGLARLDWTLADEPDMVIVELGSNDALRGIDPAVSRANLDAILAELDKRRIPVLLAGMLAPRNLGNDYVTAFDGMYRDLAAAYRVPLYPFFLDGVAAEPELNQADGMHPNAEGVAVIVDGIMPQITVMLDALGQEGT